MFKLYLFALFYRSESDIGTFVLYYLIINLPEGHRHLNCLTDPILKACRLTALKIEIEVNQ